MELSHIVDENIKMVTAALENYLAVSYKFNQKPIAWPNQSTPTYLHKRNKNTYPQNICIHKYTIHKRHIYMHTNVHNSFIHYSLELETTQMSIIMWMDKQDTIYVYNGIILTITRN